VVSSLDDIKTLIQLRPLGYIFDEPGNGFSGYEFVSTSLALKSCMESAETRVFEN